MKRRQRIRRESDGGAADFSETDKAWVRSRKLPWGAALLECAMVWFSGGTPVG